MSEDQRSIADWGYSVFGRSGDPAKVVGRALWEFAELVEELAGGEAACDMYQVSKQLQRRMTRPFDQASAVDEMADVVIVLMRAADECGFDLMKTVDAKMQINRSRKWKVTGDGLGQHVETQDGE